VEDRHDRQQYAAALTIDTGFTIASAVISGALAGAVTGAIVTGTAATVVLPIVGTVPGAIIGGLVGGVAGVFAALTLGTLFEGTGLRNLLIGKVADLYTRWTGGQN
jgi:F0F1-type ATP synthase assembly protein I